MRRLILLAPVIGLVAAGCGSSANKTTTTASTPASSSAAPTSSAVTISTRNVSGLGTVLVNAQGKTLYIFRPDKATKVTCTGSCASVWPPVKLSSGAKPAGSGGVKDSMLSSDPDPTGGRVVTYNGWPLYTYVTDSGPGSARGQGIALNGGLWYVMSPSGQPITKKPSSSGSSPTTTYGGSSGY